MRLVLLIAPKGNLVEITTILNQEKVDDKKLQYQVVVSITPDAEMLWATYNKRPHAYRMTTAVVIVNDTDNIVCHTTDLRSESVHGMVQRLQQAPVDMLPVSVERGNLVPRITQPMTEPAYVQQPDSQGKRVPMRHRHDVQDAQVLKE